MQHQVQPLEHYSVSGASERTRACFGNVHDADRGNVLHTSKGIGSVAEHRRPETRGRIEGKHVLMAIVNVAGHACMCLLYTDAQELERRQVHNECVHSSDNCRDACKPPAIPA
jgi:hypothetical protein